MDELVEKIDHILETTKIPDRHSFYQLQCFVIGKEATTQGKLRQCVLELKARKKSLIALELEIEECKDNLMLLDLDENVDSNVIKAEINKRRNARKRKQLELHIQELNDKSHFISEEAQFLIKTFENLIKLEMPKQWDDLQVQREYWSNKLKAELNLRVLLRQPPDTELLRTILALDNDSAVKKETLLALQQKKE